MESLLTVKVFLAFAMYHQVLADPPRDAYADDIKQCLFKHWPADVLNGDVPCPGSQLCYNSSDANPTKAQFVVCYNTNTLTPDFTAHVIVGNPAKVTGVGSQEDWHDERGEFGMQHDNISSCFYLLFCIIYVQREGYSATGLFNCKVQYERTDNF